MLPNLSNKEETQVEIWKTRLVPVQRCCLFIHCACVMRCLLLHSFSAAAWPGWWWLSCCQLNEQKYSRSQDTAKPQEIICQHASDLSQLEFFRKSWEGSILDTPKPTSTESWLEEILLSGSLQKSKHYSLTRRSQVKVFNVLMHICILSVTAKSFMTSGKMIQFTQGWTGTKKIGPGLLTRDQPTRYCRK